MTSKTIDTLIKNAQSSAQHPAVASMLLALSTNVVPYLEGPPGVAKSSLVYQMADSLGIDLIEIRPVLEDLSGIKGLPNFDTDEYGNTIVDWAVPKHFPRDPNWEGIIFIDEVVQALPSIQAALTQLVLDRRIGDYDLPAGARIVLAGNRVKDRASVNRMPTHLANRICRIPVEFHLDAWMAWAQEQGLPKVAIHFAEFRPDLLDQFDPAQEVNCTPRSFAAAARVVEHPDTATAMRVSAGLIGEGPTAELFGFKDVWGVVPTVEQITKEAETLPIPQEAHVQFAILSKLIYELNGDLLSKVMPYIERFPKDQQVSFMQRVAMHNAELAFTPEFDKWVAENASFLC